MKRPKDKGKGGIAMAYHKHEQKPLHLAKLHVHRGDTVLVLTGKDRGKAGTVQRAMPRENKVIVEGSISPRST